MKVSGRMKPCGPLKEINIIYRVVQRAIIGIVLQI